MIGEGQYGKVYKAHLKVSHFQSAPTEQIYAVKLIPLAKLKKSPKLKQLLRN
jgi:serine/threonine protein kinase